MGGGTDIKKPESLPLYDRGRRLQGVGGILAGVPPTLLKSPRLCSGCLPYSVRTTGALREDGSSNA
jgi:hypothetical protein